VSLIRPRINALFQKKVEQLITDLSKRHVTLAVFVDKTRCPNCKFDARNNTGTGVYNGTGTQPFTGRVCPVCENKGNITTERKIQLVANVRLGDEETKLKPTMQGGLQTGEAIIKTFAREKGKLQTAAYFLIDGIRYRRETQTPATTGLLTPVRSSIKVVRED
jgi:hypothetical protein